MPLTYEPFVMTFIVLSKVGSTSWSAWKLSRKTRVFFPLSDSKSWRCPFLRRSVTMSHKAMQLEVLWSWSAWNSHHLVVSRFGSRFFGLTRPPDDIPNSFHDSYNLHELDIEVVLWDTGVINLNCKVITRPGGTSIE